MDRVDRCRVAPPLGHRRGPDRAPLVWICSLVVYL